MTLELGKWLLDVAKYLATAVLISSFLGGFEQTWVMYAIGITAFVACLVIGLLLINKYNKKNKKRK